MTMLRAPIFVVLVLATADALADSPPQPPPPRPTAEPSRLVDVEIKDEDKARSASAHFTIAVGGWGVTAAVTSPVGDAFYTVKLRHDTPGTYALELGRHSQHKAPTSLADLEISTVRTLEADKRQVVGVVERPDATRTEVALTLR
jgi:hypothetical protein